MIEVARARRLLVERSPILEVVHVALEEAAGYVLAEDVAADRDLPPTDRSAMDGYAVWATDLAEVPVELQCCGEVRAGAPAEGVRVEAGRVARIFTGAIVPEGADAVVMVERTEALDDGRVRFLESPTDGQHIRRQGEDVRAGERVLSAGTLIHSAEIAALATVGRTRVPVHRRPRVAVLSTGDEVVEPDVTPAPHQVRNSNGRALLAQLAELGIPAHDLGIASDDPARLDAALAEGLAGDVLLVTGGVSVGAYDLVRERLEAAGMRVLFHRVAMKPGKPILGGRAGECLVVGLPGNPVSAFTGLHVLVAPALRRMMGWRVLDGPRVRAVLTERLRAKPGRMIFHLGRVEWRGRRFLAHPVESSSSGDALSLARANAFLVTPADSESRDAGEEVTAFPWKDAHFRHA